MGGGLLQLIAYGSQDIYLTGNPQITFFKQVHRRHTNFAMEEVEQSIEGTVTASSKVSCKLSRIGDLVGQIFLEVDTGTVGISNYGHAIIDNIVCEIGGQEIDKQYGHWMETWSLLTETNSSSNAPSAVENMKTTGITQFQRMSTCGGVEGAPAKAVDLGIIFVPLRFWFCRHPGLYLPLIALQYHDIKLNLTLSSDYSANSSMKIYAEYVYLDTDERRRFAQSSHEYLIEQVQFEKFSNNNSFNLTFNHPVKELIWTSPYSAGKLTGTPVETGGTWVLTINGQNRFQERPYQYFTRTQLWKHHTGQGSPPHGVYDAIAVYSFALKPEEHQPSGTCNFSKIDNAQLKSPSSFTGSELYVYAVNYNVLRIMSGMCGLAYSN